EPEPAPPPAPAPEPPQAEAPAPPPPPAPSSNGGGADRVLSPVVRRLIAEHQLDPDQIPGTGQGGRITPPHLLALLHKPPKTPAPAAAAPSATPTGPAPVIPPGQRDETIPFSNIRRRTAEHMVRSLATSAHTLVVTEVDYENVETVRVPAKDTFKAEEGVSLSY